MDGLEEHETQNLERARALQAHMSIGGAPAPPYGTSPRWLCFSPEGCVIHFT